MRNPRAWRWLAGAALWLLVVGLSPWARAQETLSVPRFPLEPVASGFVQPLWVTYAPGDPDSLFVVEKVGRIRAGGGRAGGPRTLAGPAA